MGTALFLFLSFLNLILLLSLSHCPPQSKQGQLLLHCSSYREMIHWFLPTQMYPIFSVTCLTCLDLFIHSSWNFGLMLYTFPLVWGICSPPVFLPLSMEGDIYVMFHHVRHNDKRDHRLLLPYVYLILVVSSMDSYRLYWTTMFICLLGSDYFLFSPV